MKNYNQYCEPMTRNADIGNFEIQSEEVHWTKQYRSPFLTVQLKTAIHLQWDTANNHIVFSFRLYII